MSQITWLGSGQPGIQTQVCCFQTWAGYTRLCCPQLSAASSPPPFHSLPWSVTAKFHIQRFCKRPFFLFNGWFQLPIPYLGGKKETPCDFRDSRVAGWKLQCLVGFFLFLIFFLFLYFISLFIYFLLCWVFVAARGLSLVVASGLLIAVASLAAEHGL